MNALDKKLSETVRLYPHLYDSSKRDYKDTYVTIGSWVEIAEAVGCSSHEEAKTKWHRLRDKFCKAKKRVDSKTSRAGGRERTVPKLFEQLTWLCPYVKERGSRQEMRTTTNVPLDEMHITIQEGRSLPELKRCTTCCKDFHCPFCSSTLFHPTKLSKVRIHLESHFTRAVLHEGYTIHRCGLDCRPQWHYHCIHCQSMLLRKPDFINHLSLCKEKHPAITPTIPAPTTSTIPAPTTTKFTLELTAVDPWSPEVKQVSDQASPCAPKEPGMEPPPASQPEQRANPATPSSTSRSARRRLPANTPVMTENQRSKVDHQQKPQDEDEQFLLSLAPTLKRLSNRKKVHIRMVIMQALYEPEFGEGPMGDCNQGQASSICSAAPVTSDYSTTSSLSSDVDTSQRAIPSVSLSESTINLQDLDSNIATPPCCQLPMSTVRLLVPPVRLMSAFMWDVAQQRNVEQYGKLAEFICLVTEMVPELLSFKQKAQLILGLRAKLILEMLQSGSYDRQTIQEHLNHVQLWTINSMQEESQENEVHISKLKFVEKVKTLLDDLSEKEHFFKEVFPVQYGARFDTALQILVWEFFSRLEEFLPVPSFSQITSSFYIRPLDSDEFEQFFLDPEDLKTLLQHHKKLRKNQLSFKSDIILSTLASKQTSEVCKDQDEYTINNSSIVESQQKVEQSLERCKDKREGKILHQNHLAEDLTKDKNEEDSDKGSNNTVGSNLRQQQDEQSLLNYSLTSPEVDTDMTGSSPSEVNFTCHTIQDMGVMAPSHSLEHQESGSAEKDKRTCPQCGKSFGSLSHMKQHYNTVHSSLKPYLCSYCGRGFSLFSIFKSHVRIHTGERPFSCSLCDKKFSQRYPLTLHLRLHRGEKPYLCSDCGKGFRGSGALLIHSRTHTGERPYHCDTCGKNYITVTRLKIHQRSHTGERPYPCSLCEKCFASAETLKKHIRIHTGEKPFKCPICHKRFAQKSNVKIHLRSHKSTRIHVEHD